MRIFFVGDELITGLGDAHGVGWVGRVLARTQSDIPIIPFQLAMPGENTEGLSARWQSEVLPRFNQHDVHKLVIGLGSHDHETGVSLARSRLHLANILDNAQRLNLSCFVVGPPPRRDILPRIQADLSHALGEVCARRGVPYVETYAPLATHEQWNTDMSMSGAYTPHQAGYGLMSWLVLNQGWHQWLGVPPM